MRKLTYDEFHDRLQAINRAMRIFGELTDNNITKAFTAYQEVLSETQRPINIPAESIRGMTGSAFDGLKHRPKCPECGHDMNLRPVPSNLEGVKSQLVCSDPVCTVVLDSEMSIAEWYDILKKMSEEDES
jgi:hypothetical protein